MNSYFEKNKYKLLDKLLPLMPESKSYTTNIDGLLIVKRDAPFQSEVCLQQPLLIFSVQGEKRYSAGSEIIDYKQGQIVFQGTPMPCSSYVLKASKEIPYIAMVFAVNMQLMTEVIYSLDNVDISSMTHAYSSLGKIEAGNDIIDSFIRLADLLNKSYNDIKVLSPLMLKEMYYFLLKTELREKLISFAITSTAESPFRNPAAR